MDMIWTAFIGFAVGLIARMVVPGKDSIGIILTAVLGIVGALLGTLIGRTMGWIPADQNIDIFGSIVGAALLLFIVKTFMGERYGKVA